MRSEMETLRQMRDTVIPAKQSNIDAFVTSFREYLQSAKVRAKETADHQGKLEEFKIKLKESEDELVKALAVKTHNEAKRMALMDAIASRKSRLEELKRNLQDQRTKRDEYAAFVDKQFQGKNGQDTRWIDEVQDAISWYNKVFGLHIEGGHGVKFTFKNISLKDPNQECFFTIRHENDTYTLLNCEPPLGDMKNLMHELNKTNGLFKFVRIMREKFEETLVQGNSPQLMSDNQDPSIISVSAPFSSVSTDGSDSPNKKNVHQVQHKENMKLIKDLKHGRGVKAAPHSPGSTSVRRSPRFMVLK